MDLDRAYQPSRPSLSKEGHSGTLVYVCILNEGDRVDVPKPLKSSARDAEHEEHAREENVKGFQDVFYIF